MTKEIQTVAKKGIVILALGHANYGNFAANLAATIRAQSSIPIHLVYNDSGIGHLQPHHKALFTSMSVCPEEYYTKNGKHVYIRAKLFLPDLTPFEETLYLDADMAWIPAKNPLLLFEAFKSVEWTMQCRGVFDLDKAVPPKSNSWCDVNEAKEAYQMTGNWYQLSSDLFYFKRTENVQNLFAKAVEIFDNPLVTVTEFDGDVPDEFAFSVACNLCDMKPIAAHNIYAAWFGIERPNDVRLRELYFAYTIGGNRVDRISETRYINLVKAAYRVLNLGHEFAISHKKKWNPKRSKL